MSLRRERGYAAIWVAAVMLFLLGAAALAVDASGFFQQASSQQRAADLACLAGAQELPESPAMAMQKAADYVRPNQPGLAAIDPTTPSVGALGAGTATWQTGDFAVTVETPYGGRATRMRVTISQVEASTFGRAVGTNSATIVEEAVCEVGSALGGGARMPFGVLTGFTGGIINYENNDCTLNGDNNAKCSGLAIPRNNDPTGSQFGIRTADNYIANMISGINWGIAPPDQDVICQTVAAGPPQPCNKVATVSGSEPSKIYRGLISGFNKYSPASDIGYLERDDGGPRKSWGNNTQPDWYDGHELGDVAVCAGGCPTAEESLAWADADDAPVVTLTAITDCDCPRFARIPIVESFPASSCIPQIPDPDDPNWHQDCTAKIIGFEWVFLLRPYFNGTDQVADGSFPTDFENQGGNTVRTIAAVKVNLSPDVVVSGRCFSEYADGAPKAVRLIAG